MALLARRSAASSTSSPGGNPGQVRFYEAKVGPDRIKPTQLRFIELALRFHRCATSLSPSRREDCPAE